MKTKDFTERLSIIAGKYDITVLRGGFIALSEGRLKGWTIDEITSQEDIVRGISSALKELYGPVTAHDFYWECERAGLFGCPSLSKEHR